MERVRELLDLAERISRFATQKAITPEDRAQLQALKSDLERSAHSLQVASLAYLVPRMESLTDALARKMGKSVGLSCRGFEIELQPEIRDALADALVHLIRNALDHGIETPADRRMVGKPPSGKMEVSLGWRGGRMHLRFADDGHGIDFKQIRSRAHALGKTSKKQVSEQELLGFLLEPGFSTREKASEVSGHGMGLSAVRESFKKWEGELRLSPASPNGMVVDLFWTGGPMLIEVVAARLPDGALIWVPAEWTHRDPVGRSLSLLEGTWSDFDIEAPIVISLPQFRIFHPLDSSWSRVGSSLIQRLLKKQRGAFAAALPPEIKASLGEPEFAPLMESKR